MITILIVFLATILLAAYSQPRFAQWLLSNGTDLEAKLYGFTAHSQAVGQFTYHYWDNQRINKPVLVLLHGFTADTMVWLRCAKHLQKDFRVIIPDLAGHGRTTFIESAGYSVPKQTERLHYFLHQLGIHESVTIAGNSMGGFIAAQFALDYPNAVNKIICVNPAGAMTDMLSPTQQMIQAGNNPFLMEDVRDFPQFYQLTMAKPPYFPGFLKTGIAHLYVEKKAQYEEIFNDFSNPEDLLNTRLTGIQCQVLMLWGGLDQIIHLSCAEVWRAHTDNITVIWEDLGHMPMLESPRLCALEIQRFLNGQLTT